MGIKMFKLNYIPNCKVCGKPVYITFVKVNGVKSFKVMGHIGCNNTQGNWFEDKELAIKDWERRNV